MKLVFIFNLLYCLETVTMLKIYRNVMVVLCLSAFVSLFAGIAAAETVYLYDIDSRLSAGAIVGQDNWIGITHGERMEVQNASGLWSGKYVDDPSGGSTQVAHNNDDSVGGWSFSLANDEDFDVSAVALALGDGVAGDDLAYGGVQQRKQADPDKLHWCIAGTNGQDLQWRLMLGADDPSPVDITTPHGVASDQKKLFRVGFAGTATGTSGDYSMQPYYQNITDSGAKTNFGSPFTITYSDLSSVWDSLQVRLDDDGELGEVRITSGEVPEPSTLALLATGLIGLLAYAWRKRK